MKDLSLRRMIYCLCCCLFVLSFIEHKLDASEEPSCEKVFTDIYNMHLWGTNPDGSPASGPGSKLENAIAYIHFLMNFIQVNKIRSVVDVGCGDWSFSQYVDWKNIHYIGLDVVKSIIERDRKLFEKPTIHFIQGDFLNMELPAADLLICKDVLHRLTNKDIQIFLSKIGKFRHCLITNDIMAHNKWVENENEDIPNRGPNRPLDLTKPPFLMEGYAALEYAVPDHIKQIFYVRNKEPR